MVSDSIDPPPPPARAPSPTVTQATVKGERRRSYNVMFDTIREAELETFNTKELRLGAQMGRDGLQQQHPPFARIPV